MDFYRDRRLLVTGGNGFLGSHLVRRLQESGCRTVLAPRKADYDLTDDSQVRAMFRDTEPDVVFHLAAVVGGIGANRANPGRFFYENAVMGLLTLEHARRVGVLKFVAIGTICSYPKFTPVPFREDDLWNGYPEETNAPYGLAKKMLLVQAQAYRQQYSFPAIFLLPVNLYGPGDNFDLNTSHVIPALIRKFVNAKDSGAAAVEVWGDGSATREFLYVEDAARGIALAGAQYEDIEPVNLGSGVEISIKELAETIRDVVGYRGEIRWDSTKPNGQPRRLLDVSRAASRFGFSASTPFDAGLRRTIEWYLSNRSDSNAS